MHQALGKPVTRLDHKGNIEMSLDMQHVAALLHIANESAKHGPVLSEIHTRAMDELKEIHNDLFKERKERGEQEAVKAAENEAARVAEAKAEEEAEAKRNERARPKAIPAEFVETDASVDRRGVE